MRGNWATWATGVVDHFRPRTHFLRFLKPTPRNENSHLGDRLRTGTRGGYLPPRTGVKLLHTERLILGFNYRSRALKRAPESLSMVPTKHQAFSTTQRDQRARLGAAIPRVTTVRRCQDNTRKTSEAFSGGQLKRCEEPQQV